MIKKTVLLTACCAFFSANLMAASLSPGTTDTLYTGTATISSSGDCKFSKKIEGAMYVYSDDHNQDFLVDSDYNIIAGLENNWVPVIDKYNSTATKSSSTYRDTTTLDNSTVEYLGENSDCNFSHDWGNAIKLFSIPDKVGYQRTRSSNSKTYKVNFKFQAAGIINSSKGWKSTKNGSQLINGRSTVKIKFSAKQTGQVVVH